MNAKPKSNPRKDSRLNSTDGTLAAPEKPLYLQDLEDRAEREGITVEQLLQQDQEMLSKTRLSPECLRPDEIMQFIIEPLELTTRASAHLQGCQYCQGLVSFAKPSEQRAARMAARLAQLPEEEAARPRPQRSRVVQWTDAVIGAVNRACTVAWNCSPAVAVLLLFYVGSPDSFRLATPAWLWTNGQLYQSISRELSKHNSRSVRPVANVLIERQPEIQAGRALLVEALIKEGKTNLAGKEAEHLVGDILESLPPKERAQTLSRIVQVSVAKTSEGTVKPDSKQLQQLTEINSLLRAKAEVLQEAAKDAHP